VDPEETTIVKESQARLDEAQKNLERVQALRTESLVPDSELERSQAGYTVAFIRHLEAVQEVYERQAIYAQRRAEFAMASQLVLETSLRAPFDGVIQTRIANVGEFLSAGSPVLEIVRVNPLRLQLDIPERQAPLIHEDQAVRISVEGETTLHEGRVARISPALNAQARMLRIEAEFLNPGHLRPGAFVRAAIVVRSDIPTLSLPTQSITSFAGTEKAFLMLTNTAIERQVILGRQQGEWVEVLEGLDAGDFVILNPVGLRSGMAIREPTSASRSVTQSEP
jgi:RND family efflux transporter MFP subunit